MNGMFDSFLSISTGNSFRSTTTGNSFRSTTIGNSLISTTIGNSFRSTTTGNLEYLKATKSFSERDRKNMVALDLRFEKNSPKTRNILRLCYIILASLDAKISSASLENGKAAMDYMSDISPEKRSKHEVALVYMIWEDILDIGSYDKSKKDEWESQLKNLITSDEREAFFRFLISRNKLQNKHFPFRKKDMDNSFKQIILHFIHDSLLKTGAIKIVRNEKNQDFIMNKGDTEYIEFKHFVCYNYAAFLSKMPEENGGFIGDISLSILNKMILNLCLKSYNINSDMTEEKEALRQYTLRRLPFHLMQAKVFDKTYDLLSSPLLFLHRRKYTNIIIASKMHRRDIQLFYLLTNHLEMSFENKKTVNLLTMLKLQLENIEKNEDNIDAIGNALYKTATILDKLGWTSDAFTTYKSALKYQKYGDDVSLTLHQLGKMHLESSKRNDGLKCYQEAFKIEMDFYGFNHHRVSETCESIAVLQAAMQNYEASCSSYQELLTIKMSIHGPESFEVSLVHKELGLLNHILGSVSSDADEQVERYEKSLIYYDLALSIAKLSPMENKSFIANINLWVGKTYSKIGNFTAAINYYNEVLNFHKRNKNDYEQISAVLEAKGDACLELKDLTSSISCYKSALLIIRSRNKGSKNIIKILLNLAYAHHLIKQYREAIHIYDEALSLMDDDNNETMSTILCRQAESYEKNNETEKAIECLTKIIDMCHEEDEAHLRPVITQIKQIGDTYLNDNALDQAIDCLTKATDICRKLKGNNDEETADLQHELSTIYIKKGDSQKALVYLKDSLRIKEYITVFDNAKNKDVLDDILDILCDIGIIEKDQGRYKAALATFRKALSTKEGSIGSPDVKVANIFHNMGDLYAKMEQYSQAVCYFDDALVMYRQCGLDEENVHVQDALLWISHLRNKCDVGKEMKEHVSSFSTRHTSNVEKSEKNNADKTKLFKSVAA